MRRVSRGTREARRETRDARRKEGCTTASAESTEKAEAGALPSATGPRDARGGRAGKGLSRKVAVIVDGGLWLSSLLTRPGPGRGLTVPSAYGRVFYSVRIRNYSRENGDSRRGQRREDGLGGKAFPRAGCS